VNLTVDCGNTYTKLAVFSQNNQIINILKFLNTDVEIFNFLKQKRFDNAILSSVLKNNDKIIDILQKQSSRFILFNHETLIPIKNLYKTPETLGLDRLAAAVGAYSLFPKNDLLIIDAGSALTIDFVTKNAEYKGGNISPGLNMRFKALNTFTSKLPLVDKNNDYQFLGSDTKSAIIAGVQNSMIAEIDFYIDKFKLKYPELKTIITGGDSFFFEKKLKNTIFVNPELVMEGLNNILIFNG
jgi:type III pantothenate kinase